MSPPLRCDVCQLVSPPSQLASFPKADDTTGYVHVHPGICMEELAAQVPEPGVNDPPAEFAAAKIRMDRLAELTGRPEPPVRAVRHDVSGLWYWADDAG